MAYRDGCVELLRHHAMDSGNSYLLPRSRDRPGRAEALEGIQGHTQIPRRDLSHRGPSERRWQRGGAFGGWRRGQRQCDPSPDRRTQAGSSESRSGLGFGTCPALPTRTATRRCSTAAAARAALIFLPFPSVSGTTSAESMCSRIAVHCCAEPSILESPTLIWPTITVLRRVLPKRISGVS